MTNAADNYVIVRRCKANGFRLTGVEVESGKGTIAPTQNWVRNCPLKIVEV